MGFEVAESVLAPEPTVSLEWEETSCLLCGSDSSSLLLEAADPDRSGAGCWFAVRQCHACGLCYTNPRPKAESIGQFYSQEYDPYVAHEGKTNPGRLARFFRRLRLKQNERKELPWVGQGRLLDFGCGGGSFLSRMSKQGWQVLGLDFSALAVERVQTQLGLPALQGTLPHPELRPDSFDVVTLWHSLEHVHEPVQVLREVHRILAPGGKVVVAVPNIDSLPFRWFGQAWKGLDLPRHLSHFAPWTLQLMLEKAGFRVEPIKMVRHSSFLRGSAQLARRRSPYNWRVCFKSKMLSRIGSWYMYWRNQSDCILAVGNK